MRKGYPSSFFIVACEQSEHISHPAAQDISRLFTNISLLPTGKNIAFLSLLTKSGVKKLVGRNVEYTHYVKYSIHI